jgi:hypothetical protein
MKYWASSGWVSDFDFIEAIFTLCADKGIPDDQTQKDKEVRKVGV